MKIGEVNYIALSSWDKHHDWPSVSGLRNIRATADKSDKEGPMSFFKKIGGKVFVNEGAFFEWAARQLKD